MGSRKSCSHTNQFTSSQTINFIHIIFYTIFNDFGMIKIKGMGFLNAGFYSKTDYSLAT